MCTCTYTWFYVTKVLQGFHADRMVQSHAEHACDVLCFLMRMHTSSWSSWCMIISDSDLPDSCGPAEASALLGAMLTRALQQA